MAGEKYISAGEKANHASKQNQCVCVTAGEETDIDIFTMRLLIP